MRNRDYKRQVLMEDYNNCVANGETCGFSAWVKLSSQSDPNFFIWLFDDDSLSNDAGHYKEEFEEFLEFCNDL